MHHFVVGVHSLNGAQTLLRYSSRGEKPWRSIFGRSRRMRAGEILDQLSAEISSATLRRELTMGAFRLGSVTRLAFSFLIWTLVWDVGF